MTKKNMTKRGFTLVEMMLVVAIIVVVAAATTFGISTYLSAARSKAETVKQQGEKYDLVQLDVNNLLNQSNWSMPVDPASGASSGGSGGSSGAASTTTPAPAITGSVTTAPTFAGSGEGGSAGGVVSGGGSGSGSSSGSTTTPAPTTTAPTTAPSTGSGSASGSTSNSSSGDVKFGNNVVIKGGLATTGKGVSSVSVNSDGSYTLKIQNDQYNFVDCKVTINVSGGKITFTGGNKYILSGFNNELWKSDTFELGQKEIEYLKNEYGLEITK